MRSAGGGRAKARLLRCRLHVHVQHLTAAQELVVPRSMPSTGPGVSAESSPAAAAAAAAVCSRWPARRGGSRRLRRVLPSLRPLLLLLLRAERALQPAGDSMFGGTDSVVACGVTACCSLPAHLGNVHGCLPSLQESAHPAGASCASKGNN